MFLVSRGYLVSDLVIRKRPLHSLSAQSPLSGPLGEVNSIKVGRRISTLPGSVIHHAFELLISLVIVISKKSYKIDTSWGFGVVAFGGVDN